MIGSEIQGRIDAAVADGDEEALRKLLNDLYEKADESAKPFDAAIQLRPEIKREMAEIALESDAALNWANRISRAARLVAYRRKTALGFGGIRIVEDGDSWFQYPLLLDDIIDQLGRDEDKAIFSLSGAGDLLGDMAARREYLNALDETGAKVMLLSGGGNDILAGGRFSSFLLPFAEGKAPDELLNVPLLEVELRRALDAYRQILTEVRASFPAVFVLGHAYDVPYPQTDGRWIGTPLAEKGIPQDVGRLIVKSILTRFGGELRTLSGQFANYRFVDLRDKVDRGRSSWFDELHPKNLGYGRAAQAFRAAIAELASQASLESAAGVFAAAAVPLGATMPEAGPGLGASASVIVLDPGHGGAPPPNTVGGSSWNNAIGPEGTLEKVLTFDVATRCREVLEGRGYRVFLSRSGDVNPSLAERAAVARERDARVFVSVHFNASTGHDAQGTETFVHPDHSDDSRRLCVAVQRAMVAELGLRDRNLGHDRGIKEGAFGVINARSHASGTAAVLHEVSFLDRVDEERKLNTEAYRQRIAEALARGIESYLGVGVESFGPEAAAGEIGDAIELAATEAGQSVPAYLGMAEAPPARGGGWQGGHALADEAHPGGTEAGELVRKIAASLARPPAGVAAGDSQNDLREFAEVDPGPGIDLSGMGHDLEADAAALAPIFAGVEAGSFDMERFQSFIDGLGLRHFVAAEFMFLGSSNAAGQRCGGRNALPPEDLWPNIARTARMLDEIRERLGAPIRILSCYRNRDYNACIGGESASLHMQFRAVDWHCTEGGVERWHQIAREVRQSSPDFAGGVGVYPRRRFIHVDTRGTNVDWRG